MDSDVIVIGAGAAGLMAARRLANRGLSVIILEARARIGGRVAEAIVPGSSERVELGAEFIHGSAPQTMALLREAGVGSSLVSDDGFTFEKGVGLRPDDRDFGHAAEMLAPARALPMDVSVNEYLEPFERSEKTFAAAQLARTFVEGFDAADPAIASVKGIAEEIGSGVDFSSSRSDSGYAPVFATLHNACVAAGVDVQLSTPVQKIQWHRGGATVTNPRGTMNARAVLVTLPAGVLRAGDVRFEPPLPPAKQNALTGIEMGPVVKVNLAFTNAFWNGAFYRSAGLSFGAYWTLYPAPKKFVVAWAGGPRAAALLAKSHDEVIEIALADLTTIFGEVARKEFVGAVWHDWAGDPLSRGAYSYVRVGGMGSREALGEPIDDTLFFAGEATATAGQGGTVHGAFASGERAAQEIERALC